MIWYKRTTKKTGAIAHPLFECLCVCVYIYIYIYICLVSCVLWHINSCRLFNAQNPDLYMLVVWISEMKLDFYHSGFSNCCLHLYYNIYNVLADMSTSLLQVFLAKLWSLHETSNHVLYLIHRGRLLRFH